MVACMAVMAREMWTDERLDDLVKQVDKGFDATKVEIRDLRSHADKGFEEVKGEIRDLRAEMSSRFDSNQRTMILGFASIVASVVATQL
jgi:ribosome recycling factor